MARTALGKIMPEPQPKQKLFLDATQKFVAYGGARGGGKSWALRYKAIALSVGFSGIRILILRRTFPELRENHTLPLKKALRGVASYSDEEKAFTFPNGSRIKLGYCDGEDDVIQYQGQEYDIICMDEGTNFTEYQFSCLTACLRGSKKYPKRFYITCNPGGVGHAWVKRLFIDKQYRPSENPEDYAFFPAFVWDNKWLMENDPSYRNNLENLPEELKKGWLYGEWESFQGQYFTEFNKEIHVCKPFDIPKSWNIYYVNDYGLDMLAGLWIAVDFNGNAYVYREIYKSNLIVSDAAEEIKSTESNWERQKISIRIAPPDLWSKGKDTGKNPVEIFADNGLYFIKADNNRVNGWMAVREWLKPVEGKDGKKISKLRIFNSCENLIRCLPLLQHDSKSEGDVSKEPHELTHAPDALRYFCISRPIASSYRHRPNFPFEDMEEEYKDKMNPLRHYLGGEITSNYINAGWR